MSRRPAATSASATATPTMPFPPDTTTRSSSPAQRSVSPTPEPGASGLMPSASPSASSVIRRIGVPDVVCVERGERRRGRLERDRTRPRVAAPTAMSGSGSEQFGPRADRIPDERLAEVEAERGEKRLGEERRTGAQGRLHEPDLPSTAGYLDRAPQAVHPPPTNSAGSALTQAPARAIGPRTTTPARAPTTAARGCRSPRRRPRRRCTPPRARRAPAARLRSTGRGGRAAPGTATCPRSIARSRSPRRPGCRASRRDFRARSRAASSGARSRRSLRSPASSVSSRLSIRCANSWRRSSQPAVAEGPGAIADAQRDAVRSTGVEHVELRELDVAEIGLGIVAPAALEPADALGPAVPDEVHAGRAREVAREREGPAQDEVVHCENSVVRPPFAEPGPRVFSQKPPGLLGAEVRDHRSIGPQRLRCVRAEG